MKFADLLRPVGLRRSAVYLEEVEALRGLAVVLVVASHFLPWLREGLTGDEVSPAYALLVGGHTGVSLFFVLSGFLLSQPFLEQAAGGRRVALATFYRRRALRILPLYYVAVLVALALTFRSIEHPSRVLAYFFFMQRLPGVPQMAPHSSVWWSLCTEAQFYALLPLLGFATPARFVFRIALVALAIYVVAYGATLTGWLRWGPSPFLDSHGIFGRAPMFAYGIIVAWLYGRADSFRAWMRRSPLVRNGLGDVVLVAALWSLGMLLQRVGMIGYYRAEIAWPSWHLLEGLLWAVILWLLLTTPLRTKPLLSNRPMRLLGILSYSIYMVHNPLAEASWNLVCRATPFECIGWTSRSAAAAVLYAVAVLGLSTVTYLVIERPFLRRKGGS